MADDPAIERLVVALPGSDLLRVYLPAPEPGTVVDHEGKVYRLEPASHASFSVAWGIAHYLVPLPATPEAERFDDRTEAWLQRVKEAPNEARSSWMKK